MTVRARLLFFGGFLAIIILLIVVVAVVSARGPNTLKYGGPPIIEGERYVTDEFQPAFSFEAVGEGWFPDVEAAYVVALMEGFAARDGTIEFLNVENFVVFDPSEPPGEADSMPAPKDMASWFQQHPYLDTEEAQPVRIGGAEGVYFDAVATYLPKGYGNLVCPLGSPEGHEFCVSPPDKVRIIVLEDVKGGPVTIMLWSQAVDFEEFLPRAQKLLKTVEWEDA